MLTATILALVAAVLHAAWNLSVKQSVSDRFIALWGQFFVAGVLSAVVLVVAGGIPARGFLWAGLSGLTHVPYCLLLAKAYSVGDFSVAYPIARGGGALVAGIGGIALLGDSFRPLGVIGMIVVATGLVALAGRGASKQVIVALCLAATIGTYSVLDAKGIRKRRHSALRGSDVHRRHDNDDDLCARHRAGERHGVGDAQLLAPLHRHGDCLGHHLRARADRLPTRAGGVRDVFARVERADRRVRRRPIPR